MRHLLYCLALAACAGQAPQPGPGLPEGITPFLEQQLPVDRDVEVGELDNGLRYYVRRNVKPEQRAELRLVVRAGSVLESQEQRGLAHFVEHMAFNGTAHFAEQQLVDYLESVGMRFGPDLNAYTSFDETVYMLQVPTDNAQVMEQAFLILADWAGGIAFAPGEIDKERGVVIEEWRLGRGAGSRLREQQIPVLLRGSRYAERLPIGEREVLEGFAHETLRRFYTDWYRPEMMAVIAVGDFDPEWVERQIEAHFSSLPASAERVEPPLYPVPDHQETLFAVAADPEATRAEVAVYYKRDVRAEGTVGEYRRMLVESLYHQMLNHRLYELTIAAEPPFLFGASGRGRLVRSKEAQVLRAGVRENGLARGLEALLTEARRVRLHGFEASELERQKKTMLRRMEQVFRESDKTPSENFADEYGRNFLRGEPIPGIAYEWGLYQTLLPEISLQEVERLAGEYLREENRVVVVSLPEKEGVEVPSEEELLAVFAAVEALALKAYQDDVRDLPLFEEELEPAAIVQRRQIPELGIEEWALENGARVLLKPTDFKNDEVLFAASSPGGHSLVADADYVAALTAESVVREGGVGRFDQIELEKLLSGKVVEVAPWISGLQEGLKGSASPQDLETLFQLAHLYFTAPRPDSTAFGAYQAWIKGMLENRSASPEAAFSDTVQVLMAQYHFRARPWSEQMLEEMDLDKSLRIYRERFADAGDFTFFLAGNFTREEVEPLVRRYLATLPAAGRVERWRDVGMEPPKGVVERYVYRGVEEKSLSRIAFSGPFAWTYENFFTIHAMAAVLRIKLREVLREEMGGTYGVGVNVSTAHYPDEEYSISLSFGCAPERVEEMTQAVFAQIDSLRRYGPAADYVGKVQEMQRRQHEVRLQENGFWLDLMDMAEFHGLDPRLILDYEAWVDSLSPERVQAAAQRYFDRGRYVRVVLLPEFYKDK